MNYTIDHIGMNHLTAEEAAQTKEELMNAFGLDVTSDNSVAFFVGTIFEVMKHNRRGTIGHIALKTDDVEAAMAELGAKGYTFLTETIRRDERGKINFVYLAEEFGGYAVHLMA